MKNFFRAFLLAAVFVAVARCFPGATQRNTEDSAEKSGQDTVLVLPQQNPFSLGAIGSSDDDDDDADDGLGGFTSPGLYYPFRTNPLDGFMSSMQHYMDRLRAQMASVLTRIPEQSFFNPWARVPEGANTTSTTKIIDGHVVTINETTYSNSDDGNSAIFRVRIIDVKPQEDTTESAEEGVTSGSQAPAIGTEGDSNTESATPARSVETVEDFDNEIPKNQVDTLTA